MPEPAADFSHAEALMRGGGGVRDQAAYDAANAPIPATVNGNPELRALCKALLELAAHAKTPPADAGECASCGIVELMLRRPYSLRDILPGIVDACLPPVYALNGAMHYKQEPRQGWHMALVEKLLNKDLPELEKGYSHIPAVVDALHAVVHGLAKPGATWGRFKAYFSPQELSDFKTRMLAACQRREVAGP